VTQEKDKKWQAAVRWLKFLANAANIGIVLHIVITLLPFLASIVLFKNIVDIITAGTDPFIYLCKGLDRIIRLCGRKKYDVEFIEERYGSHKKQNTADMISSILFGIAITAFILSHCFFPFLSSIAWIAGLAGTGINIYFDETVPAKKAEETYRKNASDEVNEYYKEHYYESIFYSLLLVSLLVFLPCKSLAESHCLPTITENIFKIIAVIGSALVVALNLLRAGGNLPCFLIYRKLPGLDKVQEESRSGSARSSTASMMSPRLTRTSPTHSITKNSKVEVNYPSPIPSPRRTVTDNESIIEPENIRGCTIS